MPENERNVAERKSRKTVGLILAIPVILLAIYAIMAASTYTLPMTAENTGSHILMICIVFAILLGVPYLILKAGFHTAHMNNPKQDELSLKDIPKDERQIRAEH
jgi:hypothetical protein